MQTEDTARFDTKDNLAVRKFQQLMGLMTSKGTIIGNGAPGVASKITLSLIKDLKSIPELNDAEYPELDDKDKEGMEKWIDVQVTEINGIQPFQQDLGVLPNTKPNSSRNRDGSNKSV